MVDLQGGIDRMQVVIINKKAVHTIVAKLYNR